MKKLFAILAFLFVFVAAPSAFAGPFTYSLTEVFDGITQFSWTTDPIAGVTGSTTVPSSQIASDFVNPSGLYNGATITGLILGATNDYTEFNPSGDTSFFVVPVADFTKSGTYSAFCGAATCTFTVTGTTSTTPEPSPIFLLGTGLLGLFLMALRRKCLA
jgi:hypothetical protein